MSKPLLTRLYHYQKERFPLPVHIPLIVAFSFSAIGYSMALNGRTEFISLASFAACVFTNLTLFFILRVSDEHKDIEDDRKYRTYLPVPRGLVTLKEIRVVAIILFIIATAINLFLYTGLLYLYVAILLYLALMRYEFFAKDWLKKHQVAYILSHMFIIPIIDIYASAYDWKLSGDTPHSGLLLFFIVSYLNGLLLEIGRKMRVTKTEEHGVVSYTKLWGAKTAPAIWIGILLINTAVAWNAITLAGYSTASYQALLILATLSAIPALLFIYRPGEKKTKWIEAISLLWTLGMYLLLGGIPLLTQLIT